MGKVSKSGIFDIFSTIGVLMFILGLPTLIISFIVSACVDEVGPTLSIILVGSGISVLLGGVITCTSGSEDPAGTALSTETMDQSVDPVVHDDSVDSVEINAEAKKHKRLGIGLLTIGVCLIVGTLIYAFAVGGVSKIVYAGLAGGVGMLIIGVVVMDFAEKEVQKCSDTSRLR